MDLHGGSLALRDEHTEDLAAACAGLRELTLGSWGTQHARGSEDHVDPGLCSADIWGATVLPALASACTLLTHLRLARLGLGSPARESLGALAAGALPALQSLELLCLPAEACSPYPQLLQRVTLIQCDCRYSLPSQHLWPSVLLDQPAAFHSLHSIHLPSWQAPFADVGVLRTCPQLRHLSLRSLVPPPQPAVGLWEGPSALTHLSVQQVQAAHLLELPCLTQVQCCVCSACCSGAGMSGSMLRRCLILNLWSCLGLAQSGISGTPRS
jgi:hypothetical protein